MPSPSPASEQASVRDKLREGEAIPSQNSKIVKWRYLLDKIRTFFEENPKAEF